MAQNSLEKQRDLAVQCWQVSKTSVQIRDFSVTSIFNWAQNVKNIPQNAIQSMMAAANPAGTATATIGNVLGAGLGAVFGKSGLNVGAVKTPLAAMGKVFLECLAPSAR